MSSSNDVNNKNNTSGFSEDSGMHQSDGRDELVFHYNRERRLARAPENVRRAYEVGYTPNKGFLKGLTANPGLRSILAVIVIMCIVIVGTTFFRSPPNTAVVDDVKIVLKALPFENRVYITITCIAGASWNGDPVSVISNLQILDSSGILVGTYDLAGVFSGKPLELRAILNDYTKGMVNASVFFDKTELQLTVSVDRN